MSFVSKGIDAVIGTKDSLPHDIREIAMLRSEVIAWTALDPALAPNVGPYSCGTFFGIYLTLPCFWPHLLCIWPCLCKMKTKLENTIRSQYWILTETELKVVIKHHDTCCIPGYSEAGDFVQSIPLENITDCGAQAVGKGFTNSCVKPLPIIFVDTAGHVNMENGSAHEAMGYGLARQEWFIREILNRRDIVKAGGCGYVQRDHAFSASVVATPIMERGSAKSPGDRIKDITDLHMSGVLTQEEFEKKRQEIINSI
jgi:hypothetical protein